MEFGVRTIVPLHSMKLSPRAQAEVLSPTAHTCPAAERGREGRPIRSPREPASAADAAFPPEKRSSLVVQLTGLLFPAEREHRRLSPTRSLQTRRRETPQKGAEREDKSGEAPAAELGASVSAALSLL